MTRLSMVALLVACNSCNTLAFAPPAASRQQNSCSSTLSSSSPSLSRTPTTFLRSSEEDGVFVPSTETATTDDSLDKVERFGAGSAKAKRGRKKGNPLASAAPATTKESVKLVPEEVFYEGPPAITETIGPTLSIVTVLGIVPAAAAWARQAWVRYRITTRRIRVTSGVGGNDMAEIVYPDVMEIRTAKRLFGDGDMVFFLRDGARFEMRNIPNFEEATEFILKQVAPEVAAAYRETGVVN